MVKKICSLFLITVFTVNSQSFDSVVLFSGNSNKQLSQEIADCLKIPLSSATIGHFNDGEINIQLHANIRKKDKV